MLILSCAIAALSCAYFAYRMGSGAIGGNAMTGGPSRAPAMDESNGVEMSVARSNDQITVHVKDDNSSAGSNAGSIAVEPASFIGYHLRMFIIAMYSAMLLTDWGVAAETEVDSAARSYTVRIASAYSFDFSSSRRTSSISFTAETLAAARGGWLKREGQGHGHCARTSTC